MKTKLLFCTILAVFAGVNCFGQTSPQSHKCGTTPNHAYWKATAEKRTDLDSAEKQAYIKNQEYLYHRKKDPQRAASPFVVQSLISTQQKGFNPGTVNVVNGPCTNIDFETSNLTGWTTLHGYHPNSSHTPTCCPLAGGKQVVLSSGTDPHGGFPVVYPGGGGFSLKLGDDTPGSDNAEADRVEQTFSVTAANANFTYRYAVVLENPNHNPSEQPAFEIQMLTYPGGAPIPCTYYQVVSGAAAVGFSPSLIQAGVQYKPWTSVAVDLTPMIGQNVTIRFTVMDCSLNGHFGYAYLDASCTNFATTTADTTCANVPFQMCAPAGFASYLWTGPTGTLSTSQCMLQQAPGIYTCSTFMGVGCMGPDFTHTLVALSVPSVSYTTVSPSVCATQYTFTGTSSIASGSIVSYTWDFGDGSVITSSTPPPTQIHNFPGYGTYKVKFKAVSNRGCMDSLVNTYTVFPFPSLVYSPPSNCVNTVVQFTNSSFMPGGMGTIASYSWNLGNGVTSSATNPTDTYTANGTYSITLVAVSNQGCTSSLSSTLGIFPPPIISFTANNLCDANGTAFTPATSTAIASGNLATYLWDFGDGGTSTSANPTHTYTAPGTYTVNFSAVSNHNCPASTSNSFIISPSPSVAFATTSVNACATNFTFNSTTGIAFGTATYTWSFGGTNTSSVANPTYTFPGIGSYTVRLTGVSNMGCITTATQPVTIYPYPVITMSVPASCENAIFSVSTTAVSGSVTSYSWDFGDPASGAANTSTLQNPTHYYSVTNNYTITLNLISNLNCPSTSLTPIVVYPNPVASLSFTTAAACDLPFIFDGTTSSVSAIGASSVTNYNWSFGGGGTSTLSSGTGTFPGNGSYSVSLIVTTNHNCMDTVSLNYLVHPVPKLDFTVTPTCLNVPMNILNSASISPVPQATASIASYTWNFGDGTFDTNPAPGTHTFPASGFYTLSYGATSNKGCSALVSRTVEVYALPNSSVTAPPNVCIGNSSQFTSTNSIASSTIFAYDWIFGDGNFGSSPNTVHTYTSTGSFPVTFVATSNNGCLTTVTKTVDVSPLPVASFTANNACLNAVTQFTDNSTISAGSVTSFTWNFGDGQNSSLQNPPHTYSVQGTYVPTVTVGSNQGCTASATETILVHPLPNLAFSPASGCEGSAIQFTNSSNIALGTISTYTWNFGNSNSSNLISPTETYSYNALNQGIYTVTLSATSNQGCNSSASTDFSVYPFPQVTITPIGNNCINNVITFTPNITIPLGSITSYVWTFGDGITSTYTVSAPTITTTAPHTYTAYNNQYSVTLLAISDKNCQRLGTTTVQVYPRPIPGFVVGNLCLNDVTTFTNTSIIPSYSINSHYWDFYDGAFGFSTANSPTYAFSSPGTHTIELTETSSPEFSLNCSASVLHTIEIHALPNPSFISDKVCFGAATSFTNTSPVTITTSPSTNSIVAWSWDFQDNGTTNSTAANGNTFTYPALGTGTQTAKLTARSNYNCINSFTSPVVVYASPAASFSAPNVCFGSGMPFTESSTIALGSINSYSWNFGDTQNSLTQAPTHTYSTYGPYTVNLTVTSNQNCVNTMSATVLVHPMPNLVFSPSSGCEGSVIQFSNSSTIPVGTMSYTWNLGNGNNSNLINPSETYSYQAGNQGLYTVSLTALSSQGCTKTGTNNLQIYPYPQGAITPIGNNCINNVITFTPNISIPFGTIDYYVWTFGDGITSSYTVSAPTITTTAPHTYTAYNNQYTVTLLSKSDKNCSSISTTTVRVYPRPIPNFAVSNICLNDVTQFNATSIIPQFTATGSSTVGIDTHYWDFDAAASGTSSAQSPTVIFSAPGVHTVQLTETSSPAAEATLSCPSSITKTIEIHPLPSPSFVSNNVCSGTATSFTNTSPVTITTSPTTNSIVAWSWEFLNNGTIHSINPSNNSFTYPASTSTGSYVAKLTARTNYNCTNTYTAGVTVYANPTPSFVANATCLGGTTNFTNLSTYGSGAAASHTWILGPFNFSTTLNPSVTFTSAGIYTVELTELSTLGCTAKYAAPISIFDTPAVNFTVNNTCVDQGATFSNLSTVNSGSITIWKWDFDGNGSWDDSTHFSAVKIYPTQGTYTVKLLVGSSSLCSSVKTASITVHPSPGAEFTFATPLCEKDDIAFSDLSTSPEGIITKFMWDLNNDRLVDRETRNPKYSYSAPGTYTSVLAVSTEFGCMDTASKVITVNPKAVPIVISDKTSACPNICINFKNKSQISAGTIDSFEWDFGDGTQKVADIQNPTHCYKPGTYNLNISLKSDVGCTSSLSMPGFITIYEKPKAAFVVDPEEIDEDLPSIEVRTSANDVINTRYFVSDGSDYKTENFTHNFKNLDGKTKPMVVQIVKNKYGCADTTYRILPIKPAFALYFPNVFTPNGDGVNDFFEAKGIGVVKFHIQIFDRWGHLEFESGDMLYSWDGKTKNDSGLIKQDVYVWKAEATDVFSKRHVYTGQVTVLR